MVSVYPGILFILFQQNESLSTQSNYRKAEQIGLDIAFSSEFSSNVERENEPKVERK